MSSHHQPPSIFSPQHLQLFTPTKPSKAHNRTGLRSRGYVRTTRPAFKKFLRLPSELIVMIMCNMNCYDLLKFLQSCMFARRIFLTHQMAIFKGIQECQFPEFAGVLGAMPGFMPLTTPPARSPTQIKALNDVAISINWRHRGRALPKDDPAAVVFANAGGWRFLSFLSVVQQTVLEKAKYVQKYLVDGQSPGELDVEVEAVRKATFCFEKMTWGSLETVEPEADMRARVNDRLAVFNRERPETRELMLRILDLVMAELVIALNFRATVSRWVTKYRAARREGPQSMFQDDRETRRVAATILTGLLFQVCFSRGVHMLMGICGGETARGVTGLRELVLFNFRDCLRERLEFDKGGRAWRGDLWMEEGCLWAEGMGYDVGNML